MASAATAAVSEIITDIVSNPFSILGSIGGKGDGKDLEFVEFAAGSSDLDEAATRNLDELASALGERPTLALTINGTYDTEVDSAGLREAAFTDELVAQGVTQEQLETIVPLETLESLYSSRVSAAEVDALRAQHTTPGEAEGAEPVFDEVAYRDDLHEALIASQPVDQATVAALAPARAEAIRGYLVDQAGLDPARVSVAPEATAEEPEKKETAATGSENWVRCKLELAAE